MPGPVSVPEPTVSRAGWGGSAARVVTRRGDSVSDCCSVCVSRCCIPAPDHDRRPPARNARTPQRQERPASRPEDCVGWAVGNPQPRASDIESLPRPRCRPTCPPTRPRARRCPHYARRVTEGCCTGLPVVDNEPGRDGDTLVQQFGWCVSLRTRRAREALPSQPPHAAPTASSCRKEVLTCADPRTDRNAYRPVSTCFGQRNGSLDCVTGMRGSSIQRSQDTRVSGA